MMRTRRADVRAKGTGMEARLRRDGRWEARFVGADGRDRSVYAKTKRAAEDLRDERLRELRAGIDPSLQPLAEYLERYLARRSRSLAPSSVERYGRLIRIHVAGTAAGAIPIAKLTADDLDDLYAERLAAGLAPKTLELLHTLIHGGLAVAQKRGKVVRNVADLVDRPTVRRRERTTLTRDQARALLEAARGHRLEAFITLAVQVGPRHGELLGLRWADVDWDAGMLRIRRQVDSATTKDRRPRGVQLPERSLRALRAHRARQAERRMAAGGAYEEALDLVFAGPWGEPLDRRQVRVEFHRIREAAGLPHLTVHDLRHSCATLLLEEGIPSKVVAEMLGHHSTRQTDDTYSHVTPTIQAQAKAAMDRAVGG